jgi:hypothetical protein
MKSKLLAVAFCLAIFTIGMVPPDAVEAQPLRYRTLGGVNLSAYCQHLGYQTATLVAPKNVNCWRCYKQQNGWQYWTDISVTNACRWQYNNKYAYGWYSQFSNPYSWVCRD